MDRVLTAPNRAETFPPRKRGFFHDGRAIFLELVDLRVELVVLARSQAEHLLGVAQLARAPGAATAPDGILSRDQVEPAAPASEEPVAFERTAPETPAAQREPEVSAESVFGDAPTERERDKSSDPQTI